MKYMMLLCLLTIPHFVCYGQMAIGKIDREIISNNMTEHDPLNYVSDEQNYTSGIGGIIFAYPSGFFTQPPVVQISIEQNVAHPDTLTYTAEVVANTVNSTTIMVYQISGGTVSEAPTDVVMIGLLAIDYPL